MISGWQRSQNGQIEYSDRLPEDARISLWAKLCFSELTTCIIWRGLKLLVTPILAGLLENNVDKMMEFNDFFGRIDRISKMKV